MTAIPEDVIAAAQAGMRDWGVYASVSLAQWALESGWGAHMPEDSNNPFGIKAVDGQASVAVATHEYIGGHYKTIVAAFRKFDSIADAFDAHAELLSENPVYGPCWAAADATSFAMVLTGRYATDPNYGSELCAIMKDHDLTQYDQASSASSD
jgi:flagellum-specific peptidoglycan hydrolase FlgJ